MINEKNYKKVGGAHSARGLSGAERLLCVTTRPKAISFLEGVAKQNFDQATHDTVNHPSGPDQKQHSKRTKGCATGS